MNEKELLGQYKLVVGLEIHIQAKTGKKMFCGCSADIWETEPNTHTCPTCLGLPGALPVPNFEAVKKTQLLGLALGCTLNKHSRFDRKHYFYPDLPKGFQISQYKQPLCENGKLELGSGTVVDIERIHLEEDTAKSFHKGGKTLVDFNKSGIPLIELVTRPTFTSVSDAVDFAKKLRDILRPDISAAEMQKGHLRIEPNISLRTEEMEKNDELPSYKVEVKNINSFKFMERAVKAEIVRQREILEKSETPLQENRGYDEKTGKTVSQRSKEEAHDYRYFPEPDIPPMEFDEDYLKELEEGVRRKSKSKLVDVVGVREDLKAALVKQGLIEEFKSLVDAGLEAEKIAKLLVNRKDFRGLSVEEFREKLVKAETVVDIDLGPIVKKTLSENRKAVEDYKKGKEAALQFLLGTVMRETKGKASSQDARTLLLKELSV